jgi:hypothetical protein
MGYFLIYENMLTTVLVARDRWLVPSSLHSFLTKSMRVISGPPHA